MTNKVVMQSEKVLENINRIKSIISILENSESDEERLRFMNRQLEESEKLYQCCLENDGPYYKDGTLDYYMCKFNCLNLSTLETSFVDEVVYYIESDYKKNKLNAIKNIVKAYNIRKAEIMNV